MILDFHAHFHHVPAEPKALRAEAQRLSVGKLCVSNVSSYIPAPDEVRRLNAMVYEGCQIDPDLYIPFTYVNPLHGPQAIDMLEDGLTHGMQGIKLWVSVWADDPSLDDIAQWAIAHDVPIMHHSWIKWNGTLPSESQAHQIARLGERFPDLKLVMAHMGGDWEYGVKAIRHCESIGVDTSGSYGDAGVIEFCVNELGEDRVYFGSDVPGVDWAFTLAKVSRAKISDTAKEKILGGNAAAILGLA